jgi:RNA polymerase-associated protein
MSDHYSLIDCYIAPFLWRLPSAGLPFSKQPQALIHYAERVFARTAFQLSLSQAEQEMADA